MLFFCMERNHKSRDLFISVLIVNTTETIWSVNICEHYGCSNCCISFGKNKEQLNKHTNISWIKKSAKSVKISYILVNSVIDMWETFMCRRRHKQTETGKAGSSSTTQGHKVFFETFAVLPGLGSFRSAVRQFRYGSFRSRLSPTSLYSLIMFAQV